MKSKTAAAKPAAKTRAAKGAARAKKGRPIRGIVLQSAIFPSLVFFHRRITEARVLLDGVRLLHGLRIEAGQRFRKALLRAIPGRFRPTA